ncbi:hypothetical protein ACIPL1_21490 [Pseudomonas sp. NPDC090202]|uniref:hypothetical protein n=1 Tax=unclassified Pseudomonas TaxID=196821 RepID=UPI003824F49B
MSQAIVVPGRPGFNALLWWFQGPSANLADYRFELDGKPLNPVPRILNVGTVLGMVTGKAGEVAQRTFLAVTTHNDGAPGAPHTLRVFYKNSPGNLAYSRTLPSTADGLKVVVASCYYDGNNRLLANAPLPQTYLNIQNTPHVKVLSGDQIYLDLEFWGLVPAPLDNTWQRYEEQWYESRFLAWMSRGGNLCIADDHEFWNNYPSSRRAGILSGIFKRPPQAIADDMNRAFMIYQAVLNADPDTLAAGGPLTEEELHCFEFPGKLAPASLSKTFSMLVLDTRTQRSDPPPAGVQTGQFSEPAWLATTIQRVQQREAPVLLVTSQSMLDKGGDATDSNLNDYKRQFDALWLALLSRKHSTLLLTGDIHWSRAQQITKANSDQDVHDYEIVSSALSRIAYGTGRPPESPNKIEGGGSTIRFVRTGETFASNNYAILEFENHSFGLRCVARWWMIDGDGKHIPVDTAETLGSNARQQMFINLDLS